MQYFIIKNLIVTVYLYTVVTLTFQPSFNILICFFRINWCGRCIAGFVVQRQHYKCHVHMDWKKVMQLYCEVPSKYLRFYVWSLVKDLVWFYVGTILNECMHCFCPKRWRMMKAEPVYRQPGYHLCLTCFTAFRDSYVLWRKRKRVKLN